MNAADTTCIVAHMPDSAVDELLGLLKEVEVTITRPPRSALVMMPLIDSFQVEFNLGEVLVTEAAVSIAGQEGYGMVIGDDPRRALGRAAAAAIIQGSEGTLRGRVETLLSDQASARESGLAREWACTTTTRVNFDLMAGA